MAAPAPLDDLRKIVALEVWAEYDRHAAVADLWSNVVSDRDGAVLSVCAGGWLVEVSFLSDRIIVKHYKLGKWHQAHGVGHRRSGCYHLVEYSWEDPGSLDSVLQQLREGTTGDHRRYTELLRAGRMW